MLMSTKQKVSDTAIDRLPSTLPLASRRERVRVSSFGGLDMGAGKAWGIADMSNLSPRRAPSLATRPRREFLLPSPTGGKHHGMVIMAGDLYLVRGTHLYRVPQVLNFRCPLKAVQIGELSDTDKCMTVFGGRLLILPDKVYLDDPENGLRPMELDTGVLENVRFCGDTITLPEGTSWQDLGFFSGDSVCVSETNGAVPVGYYRIRELNESVATVTPAVSTSRYTYDGGFYEEIAPDNIVSSARLQRLIPDMQGMTVVGDRLCGYNGKTVYIGAEGEAFAWYQNDASDSHGPTILRSYTDGDFTACIAREDELMLFKSSSIVRLTGTRADSFALSEIRAAGIPAELSHTLCEMEGTLYYHGSDGVYGYGITAQKPQLLGKVFEGTRVCGCAVAYEEGYYISLVGEGSDGKSVSGRYLYEPRKCAWYVEVDDPMQDGIRLGDYLCSVDEKGDLWLSRTDGKMAHPLADSDRSPHPVSSFVAFVPDYANDPDGLRPVNLYLRATSDGTGELRVLLSFADGRCDLDADPENTREVGRVSGQMKDRLLRIPLPHRHCDHMAFALEMLGDWVIHEITLEYEAPRH